MIDLQLSTITPLDLTTHIGNRGFVVIVGSGISGWEPSTLPTGQDFTAGVKDALFSTPGHPSISSNDIMFLKDHLDNIPFEMILERCPDQGRIGQLLSSLYSGHSVNEIHQALGDLARSGKIHSIITTNYDLGLDVVLSGGPLPTVVSQSDAPPPGDRVYFKIHGCVNSPGTMIYSLSQESELPLWKKNVLSSVLSGRPLLLIGYSGLDFEICPELKRCSPSKILWNFFSNADKERSPGLKHVQQLRTPQHALIGDMRKLFSLLGVPVSPTYASGGVHNIGDELRSLFSSDALLLWRARVLTSIGHARLALDANKPLLLRSSTDPDIVAEYAQALFQNGQYRASADQYFWAANNASDYNTKLLRKLDACDALRCFGGFREARMVLKSVYSEARKISSTSQKVLVRAILKDLLLIGNHWLRRKKLLKGWGCHALKVRAKKLIEEGAPLSLSAGLWLDFQQFQFWAERFNFPTGTLSARGGFEPLPTIDGYKHLGYYIPHLMQMYDSLFDKSKFVSKGEVEKGYDSAAQMGCHPLAWKLCRGAIYRFNNTSRWKIRHKLHFSACQYKASQKIAYRLAWPI